MQCLSNLFRSGDIFSVDLCRRALKLDGGNVLALGLTALATIYPVIISQSSNPKDAIKAADELASRALAVDPKDFFAHEVKAWVLTAQGRHEESIVEGERCLALNPSFVDCYTVIGIANNLLNRPDHALELIDKAIRLSPRDPFLSGFYEVKAEAFFIKQQDGHAIEWTRRSIAAAPVRDPYAMLMLISALALSGQQAEAGETVKLFLADPGERSRTVTKFQTQQLSLANSPNWIAYNERFAEGLRKAGFPE